MNEAYLQLVGQKDIEWENRAHFFAVSARVMRHILVDYARQRGSSKRGGSFQKVALDSEAIVSQERARELVALDEALEALNVLHPRRSNCLARPMAMTLDNRSGRLYIAEFAGRIVSVPIAP